MGTIMEASASATAAEQRRSRRTGAVELADAAIRSCLQRADRTAGELDLLINAGVFHDKIISEPAFASLIQEDIGANLRHLFAIIESDFPIAGRIQKSEYLGHAALLRSARINAFCASGRKRRRKSKVPNTFRLLSRPRGTHLPRGPALPTTRCAIGGCSNSERRRICSLRPRHLKNGCSAVRASRSSRE